MKKIPKLIQEWFSPKALQGLDIQEIMSAMEDRTIRNIWVADLFDELQRLNLEVDNRLLNVEGVNITDLAARRKAYQDVLVAVLSAKRQVKSHTPQSGSFDLDSVTVNPA